MTRIKVEERKITATERALFAYLDDLLHEGTEAAKVEAVVPVVAQAVVAPALVQALAVEVLTDSVPAVEIPLPDTVMQTVAPALTHNNDEAVPDAVNQAEKGYPNGRPWWAQSRFDALIFRVGGLKLAVPLVALGLIHKVDRRFNALPHQSPWFLGFLRTPDATIKVIDTALLVMPERYSDSFRKDLRYVVTLHGHDWGLACQAVDKTISLDPEAVNWRSASGKRAWMAGTVREHMCAIIEPAGFQALIGSVEAAGV